MIDFLIKKALDNAFLTIIAFAVIIGAGIVVLGKTPVDALPDLSENQVVIMTQWSGQSPRNIEDQVTYPLTVSMQGLAGVRDVRAMSQVGISMVTVIFEDNIDIYFARDRVSERLATVRADLPGGVTPVLGPDATGLGQIFMYTLESDAHTLTELRSLQDFTVQYALESISGVAEVAPVGGYVKSYQVVLDPVKLSQYGISISTVMQAIQGGNNNVSGKVIEVGDEEIAVEGVGFFTSLESLDNLTLRAGGDGAVVKISDVGRTRLSGNVRRAVLADEEEEKVGGIVVMRYGENPLEVIESVKAHIAETQKTLPEGVTIVPFYDRTTLIEAAIDTLRSVLTLEIIITALILGVFLWHFGSTIIVVLSLLVGVLLTFIFMYAFGIPSNIMSLGGIAIAIGTMVDSAIVISENAYRKLLEQKARTLADRVRIVKEATLEVGKPVVFAILIIIISFLPIFSLEGMEGKLFAPLAFTNVFAMLGALIAALFLVPLLSTYFLRGKLREDHEIWVVVTLQKLYRPLLAKALHFRKVTLGIAGGLLVIGGILFTQLGSEFMPELDEGSIMYMPMTVPDVSEARATELLLETNEIIASIPEVEKVVGKAGRANSATDPAPLAMLETFITLKPRDQWREGYSKGDIIREMNRNIKIDNLWSGFTQPIIGRIDMLSTGIRAQVGIKIFGDDPLVLEELAIEAEDLMGEIRGGLGIAAIRTTGLRYLDIELNDERLALYGVQRKDVLQAIAVGVGGATAAVTVDGRERYNIEVKLAQEYRQDIEDIKSLTVPSVSGGDILLGSVADIELTNGPATINSENGVIRSAVQMNVSGRDLVSFVDEGRMHLEKNLALPDGYYVEWAGQYENQLRAKERLMIIVPIVIGIIFLLLYLAYRDFGLVSIVAVSIPLSFVGGIIALFAADFNLSVAVWVGFIALFGNAVETGVVIVVYLENAYKKRFGKLEENDDGSDDVLPITREGIYESVMEGATLRLRPVLMTAFTSVLGLLPMITATGVGAEVQKPLALVVVGGLITSILLTLVVIPVLFSYLRERQIYK